MITSVRLSASSASLSAVAEHQHRDLLAGARAGRARPSTAGAGEQQRRRHGAAEARRHVAIIAQAHFPLEQLFDWHWLFVGAGRVLARARARRPRRCRRTHCPAVQRLASQSSSVAARAPCRSSGDGVGRRRRTSDRPTQLVVGGAGEAEVAGVAAGRRACRRAPTVNGQADVAEAAARRARPGAAGAEAAAGPLVGRRRSACWRTRRSVPSSRVQSASS